MPTDQIQDRPFHDKFVQGLHDFFDSRRPVPEVDIQQVDVICAEIFQGFFDGQMQGLGVVATEQDLVSRNILVTEMDIVRVLKGKNLDQPKLMPLIKRIPCLCSNEQLVADTSLFGPFSNESFRRTALAF